MQTIQLYVIQNLIKLLAPSSPAFGNGNNLFFQNEKQQNLSSLILQLQPTDIIFTRTDSFIYNQSRQFLSIDYDHVAIILNKEQVLHISPPIISRLPIKCLVSNSRSPLVIRPKLQQSQKQIFLKNLLNLLGTKYSLTSIPKIFLNEIQNKLNFQPHTEFNIQKLKQSRICSDAIVYALCLASNKFKEIMEKSIKDTHFNKLGYILPDDFLFLLQSIYPTVYRASTNKNHNNNQSNNRSQIFNLASEKLQLINKLVTQYKIPINIFIKLLSSLNPKILILKKILSFKSEMRKNINILLLTISLCNMLGIKIQNKQFTKKIIIMMTIIHFFGSALNNNNQIQKNINNNENIIKKYVIPHISQVEKLILPKTKL